MPLYELSVILKTMPRKDTTEALKRIGTFLLDKKVSLQKLENHGNNNLPLRTNKGGVIHKSGSYFVYYFGTTPDVHRDILQHFKHDIDIIQYNIGKQDKLLCQPCTLEEELNPPAKRKSVQKLLQAGEEHSRQRKPFFYNIYDYNYYDPYM